MRSSNEIPVDFSQSVRVHQYEQSSRVVLWVVRHFDERRKFLLFAQLAPFELAPAGRP